MSMSRVFVFLFVSFTVAVAANASEASPSPSFPQAKHPTIRLFFCKTCMMIVSELNEVASEDSYRQKQVYEDKCNGQFGLSSPAGQACTQLLDGELENIQYKLKNGWSPSAICGQFKLCN